jgi:hypothetical protein
MTNKVCPALTNENYDYMLSGDCLSHCTCMLNDRRCIGFDVVDPEDRSSQFFSKGKNILNRTGFRNVQFMEHLQKL